MADETSDDIVGELMEGVASTRIESSELIGEVGFTKEQVNELVAAKNKRVQYGSVDGTYASHFISIYIDGVRTRFVKCKRSKCEEIYSYVLSNGRASTTSMQRHACKSPDTAIKQESTETSSVVLNRKGLRPLLNALVHYSALDGAPLNACEGEGMGKLLQAACNIGAMYGRVDMNSRRPSRTTVIRHLLAEAEQTRAKLVKFIRPLAMSRGVGVTTDFWCESHTNKSYCTIGVSMIADDWKLHNFQVYTYEYQERKTHQHIMESLTERLAEFGIDFGGKHTVVVVDGATSYEAIWAHMNLESTRNYCWSHQYNRVLLNVAKGASTDMPIIDSTISNCSQLVKFIGKSELNHKLPTTLKAAAPTRWGSTSIMLDSILKNEDHVRLLLCNHSQGKMIDKLDCIDIQCAKDMHSWMAELVAAIHVMEAEAEPTAHKCVPQLFALIKHYSTLPDNASNVTRALYECTRKLLAERKKEIKANMLIAAVLNPASRKMAYIDAEMRERSHALVREAMLEQAHLGGRNCKEPSPQQFPPPKRSKSSTWESLLEEENDKPTAEVQVDDEYAAYMALPAGTAAQDLLEWWKQHVTLFPLLAAVAKSTLAVPASQASTERTFARCKHLISDHRTQLKASTVEALIIAAQSSRVPSLIE